METIINLYERFRNNVFCRYDSNQLKAKNLWKKLNNRLSKENKKNFEIEWNHYLIGELSYQDFGCFLLKLKEDLNKNYFQNGVVTF